MFDRLGNLISRRWYLIILAWLALSACLHAVAPRWDDVTHDGDLAYLPANLPSVEGEQLLRRAFPEQQAKSEIGIVVERPTGPLTAEDLQWSDALADAFRSRQSDLTILEVWNRNTEIAGEKLTSRISRNGQATVTLLHLQNEFMAVSNWDLLDEVQAIVAEARQKAPQGLIVGVTGSAAIGGDMLRSAAESIENTELTTVALVVVILLLVYRAPLLVLIPLVTIALALFVATDLLALLTQLSRVPGFGWWSLKVFTTSKIFIIVILFGAGTDFCLFLISRYREELERGLSRGDAAAEAVSRVGGALVGSAMTTICGLAMMFFADFGKFSNSGPAIALCLAVTLVASLTMAPALLRAGGRAVFWPLGIRPLTSREHDTDQHAGLDGSSRFWEWTAAIIVSRPVLILLASVALLAPLAYQGLSVRLTYDFLNELSSNCPSVQGAALARRHFAFGEMAPITVVALKPGAGFDEPDGEREIARLTKGLYDVEGVEMVRSIAEPTGDPPGYFQPFRSSGLKKLAARRHKMTKSLFQTQTDGLVGDVARFDVVLRDEPFSPEAIAILDELEHYLDGLALDPKSAWHGSKFYFVGTTSGIRDLARVTQSDQWLIEQLVVLAVLAVLIVLLRRPAICLYLIASVLFSYFVTIGTTELFFAWLYGESFDGLDWKVPIFLFVILIAVGEDYNIYLVTRVLEEQERHGPIAGLRRAVARTGGIITSCGVIMAGTFISMVTGSLRGMTELGFALSLGVMLDTCAVRPILVPAFLALMERRPSRPSFQATAAGPGTAVVQEEAPQL